MPGAPYCKCMDSKKKDVPCGGSSSSKEPRCIGAWKEVRSAFKEVDQNWYALETILKKSEEKYIEYRDKILLKDRLWTGVNRISKPDAHKGTYLARVWNGIKLKNIMIDVLGGQIRIKNHNDTEIEDIYSLPVREAGLDKIIWWSTPDADNLKKIWTKDKDTALKRLGIPPHQIPEAVISIFSWSVVKTWRKPTCLDGLGYEHFEINIDTKDPFGRAKSLTNCKTADGFSEIVHTVKNDWKLQAE